MGLGHINNNLIHIGPALPISNPYFHIPVHFAESEPFHCISARSGAVQHQYDQFQTFQSHLGWVETLGFHSEKIRRVFVRFEPFCIDSIQFDAFPSHSPHSITIPTDSCRFELIHDCLESWDSIHKRFESIRSGLSRVIAIRINLF